MNAILSTCSREDEDYDIDLLDSLVAEHPPFRPRQGVPASAQSQVCSCFASKRHICKLESSQVLWLVFCSPFHGMRYPRNVETVVASECRSRGNTFSNPCTTCQTSSPMAGRFSCTRWSTFEFPGRLGFCGSSLSVYFRCPISRHVGYFTKCSRGVRHSRGQRIQPGANFPGFVTDRRTAIHDCKRSNSRCCANCRIGKQLHSTFRKV